MIAAYPYSCETGRYTVDQLDGESCGNCGRPILPGQAMFELARAAEWIVFAHVMCPKEGAK